MFSTVAGSVLVSNKLLELPPSPHQPVPILGSSCDESSCMDTTLYSLFYTHNNITNRSHLVFWMVCVFSHFPLFTGSHLSYNLNDDTRVHPFRLRLAGPLPLLPLAKAH